AAFWLSGTLRKPKWVVDSVSEGEEGVSFMVCLSYINSQPTRAVAPGQEPCKNPTFTYLQYFFRSMGKAGVRHPALSFRTGRRHLHKAVEHEHDHTRR